MPIADPSRRRFLQLVARTGAAAGALALGSACGPPEPVLAGNVVDLPEGTLRVVGTSYVAIGRDAGGVYSMKLICTHSGCDISKEGSVAPSGIVCNCHGSRYDANGEVTKGPASESLEHCAVEIDDLGNLTILLDATVDVSWRLPVKTA
jgi:Rieske Fe-S protein